MKTKKIAKPALSLSKGGKSLIKLIALALTFNLSLLAFNIVAQPANDNCANAIVIPASNMTNSPYTYTATGINLSTATSDGSCSSCSDMGYFNVWYTVVGTGNIMNASAYSTVAIGYYCFSPSISIFTGSCGSLTLVNGQCKENQNGAYSPGACSSTQEAFASWCGTLGTTYYISLGCYSNVVSNATTSATLIVTNNVVGIPTSAEATPALICGSGSSTLSATVGTNGTNLQWSNVSCGGAAVASTVMPTTTTTYYVRSYYWDAGGTCGYSATCANVTVTVDALPATPVITQVGSNLSSNASTGNQWYNASGIISGATGQIYTPTITSHYYDIVTGVDGCVSDTSNKIYVVITGINNLSDNNCCFNIYPNPANDNIIIENTSLNKNEEILIYNIQGQLLIQQPMLQAKTDIDISLLAKGMYLVEMKTEKEVVVKNFVKE